MSTADQVLIRLASDAKQISDLQSTISTNTAASTKALTDQKNASDALVANLSKQLADSNALVLTLQNEIAAINTAIQK